MLFTLSHVILELSCTAGPMAMGAATNGESDSPTVEQQQQLYLNGGSEGLNEMPHGQSKQPKKQPFSSSSSSCEDDSDDGPDDESGKKVPSMVVDDHEFHPSSLLGLSKLRKNRQFCDVILQVKKNKTNIPIETIIIPSNHTNAPSQRVQRNKDVLNDLFTLNVEL